MLKKKKVVTDYTPLLGEVIAFRLRRKGSVTIIGGGSFKLCLVTDIDKNWHTEHSRVIGFNNEDWEDQQPPVTLGQSKNYYELSAGIFGLKCTSSASVTIFVDEDI